MFRLMLGDLAFMHLASVEPSVTDMSSIFDLFFLKDSMYSPLKYTPDIGPENDTLDCYDLTALE